MNDELIVGKHFQVNPSFAISLSNKKGGSKTTKKNLITQLMIIKF